MHPEDIMFSASVRAEQARRGSREAYVRRAARSGFVAELSDDAVAFIRARTSAYLATSSADGQPYVQHRGGPVGFIEVLDPRTLAFAEYPGNRDRKSTRLNSSHMSISYAVFCLKKKTKN